MAESSTIMALVAAFIAVAILLVIGIQILGGVQNSTNCNSLPGFNSTGTSRALSAYTNIPQDKYSGWALSCLNGNNSIQSAYSLLLVILIIVAAAAILFVVRLI